jgi:hypothetical protein
MKYRYIVLALLFSTFLFAQEEKRADCILLEDENSIICKYTGPRVDFEKTITLEWIDPNGEISRTREMTIPILHGSVYDYRYLQGRVSGVWTFKVKDGNKTYTTQFTIE